MRVSFVSALHCHLPLTQAMLASLRATVPAELEHELVLFDDASTDGTPAWLAGLPPRPGLVTLHSAQNLGFAAANNRAAAAARGEILVLLNNDLELLPGWLEPLLAALAAHPDAGVIGNLQRRVADDTLDHRGVRLDPLRRPYHDRRPHLPRARAGELTTPYPAVTAACCAVRRDLFLAAGGFDSAFRNGYEDVDLCLRLTREHGRRHYVANTSVVRHHVSAARGRERTAQQQANLRLFLARWGWPPPGPPPRLHGWAYLCRHAARPWRFHGGKLLLALARLVTGRRCQPLRARLAITDDV